MHVTYLRIYIHIYIYIYILEYKYLKRADTDSVVINFRHEKHTSGEKNKIVLDYNNKYTRTNNVFKIISSYCSLR